MVNTKIEKAKCEECYKKRFKYPLNERFYIYKCLSKDKKTGKLRCENCKKLTEYYDDEDYRQKKNNIERKNKLEYDIERGNIKFRVRKIEEKMGKKYIQVEKKDQLMKKVTDLKEFLEESTETKTVERAIEYMHKRIIE